MNTEHLKSLSKELEVVTKLLSKTISDNDRIKEESRKIETNIPIHLDKIKELKAIIEELYATKEEVESQVRQSKEVLDAQESKIKSDQQKGRAKAERIREDIKIASLLLENIMKSIESTKPTLQLVHDEISGGRLTLDEINGKIQDTSTELRKLRVLKTEELGSIHKQIVASNQELIDTRLLIEDEKTKISKPAEFLRQEEERLKLITQDLGVAQNQIAARWEKVYPTAKYSYVNLQWRQ